jgi:hypothetical protein
VVTRLIAACRGPGGSLQVFPGLPSRLLWEVGSELIWAADGCSGDGSGRKAHILTVRAADLGGAMTFHEWCFIREVLLPAG